MDTDKGSHQVIWDAAYANGWKVSSQGISRTLYHRKAVELDVRTGKAASYAEYPPFQVAYIRTITDAPRAEWPWVGTLRTLDEVLGFVTAE